MVFPFTEEMLISFVDSEDGVLYCLRRKITHPRMRSVFHLHNMIGEYILIESLPEQFVVPSVHCYAVVPKNSEGVYT